MYMRVFIGVGLIASAARGGSSATPDTSGDVGPFFDAPTIDASTCALLPSGSMMRLATPMLRNGPEAYDNGKTGPRVVLELGPSDYRMWYEAVADNLLTTVGYATSSDGITWTKQGVVMSPSAA